jgi:hypothetical protein
MIHVEKSVKDVLNGGGAGIRRRALSIRPEVKSARSPSCAFSRLQILMMLADVPIPRAVRPCMEFSM